MPASRVRKFLRPAITLLIAVLLFIYSDTSLWILGLLSALFFYGIDVGNMHLSDSSISTYSELYPDHEIGVLGDYEIDSTRCYGLFLSLRGNPVFVDIREDKMIEKRKEFARYLANSTDSLETSLDEFVRANPDYSSKQIATIGLHAKTADQGEVFWDPRGYTTLKGLEFLA